MKNFMKYTWLCFFLVNFSPAFGCVSKNVDINCGAVFTKQHVLTFFPVIREREKWPWFRIPRTEERAEYAWIAEPGTCKNGQFASNGVAFAISLGAADLGKKQPSEGTLAELLALANKNAYYTKKPQGNKQEEYFFNFIHTSFVRAKVTKKGEIYMGSDDQKTINAIKRNHPTHMRMRAILPSFDESYECVTEIERINIEQEQ